MSTGQSPVVLCHLNDDSDLLQVWLEYYLGLGVESFQFIVHGGPSDNPKLRDLAASYPIAVVDEYQGEFLSTEKARRVRKALSRLHGRWILLVDSDEFVELPYDLATTIAILNQFRANALFAPMLERFQADGSVTHPPIITDPFRMFPACSVDLYALMGVTAATSKYPLLLVNEFTNPDSGNHGWPHRTKTALAPLRGVTHHFKWRNHIIRRLTKRASSNHAWRHLSAAYLRYLERHDLTLPTTDAFLYSRAELFRRGLLTKLPLNPGLFVPLFHAYRRTPAAIQRRLRRGVSALSVHARAAAAKRKARGASVP